MKAIFTAVLLMSLTGTLLWLLFVILRPVTRKLFRATWHYCTCVLALLFLLLPVSVFGGPAFSAALNNSGSEMPQRASTLSDMISAPAESAAPPSASHAQTQSSLQLTAASAETMQTKQEAANETVNPAEAEQFSALDILPYLPYLWAAGAVLFIAAQTIKHIRFARKLSRTNLPVEGAGKLVLLEHCMRDMCINKKIAVMSNSIVTTPMLTGLFRSVLILPEVEMSDAELRMVLQHELTHLKRRDIYIKLLALIANAVHWFNPVTYRLRRELDTFCELSCDERVVSDMNPEERRFYGETILNVLCRVTKRREGLFAAFAATRRGFEKRLLRIMDFKKASKRTAAFSIALMFLLGLIGCAAGGLAGAKMEKTKELTICVDAAVKQELTLALKAYGDANPDVDIKYVILPDISQGAAYKKENRETMLSQLRTQVMAGTGPDLFILESDFNSWWLPALFQDPEIAMRGGVFCDLLPLFSQAEISVDDFNAPVMEVGQVNGKQYIVPLYYQVLGVVSNDATQKIMGDDAFRNTAGMLDGLRAMAEVPGAGAVIVNSWSNLYELLCDPYYPANPRPVDYDAQTARIDTPLLRDILETCKIAIEKCDALAADMPDMSPEFWQDYMQTEQYFAVWGRLEAMACEVGMSELYTGMSPHLDAFPTEDGGVRAEVSLYAGIRANSANKYNAVNLLKTLLSAPYQTKSDDEWGGGWDYGWPVRKGVLAERLKKYVDTGKHWGFMFSYSGNNGTYATGSIEATFSAPLTESSVNNFLAIETKITSAAFRPPAEIVKILRGYERGEIDLDTTIVRMQDYWDKSLEE